MTTTVLLDPQPNGEPDFELRLGAAAPIDISIGQLEAIARGLMIGDYHQEFSFEEAVHTRASCDAGGVHVQITVGGDGWYDETVPLTDYFHITRRLCDLCNLQSRHGGGRSAQPREY